MSRNAANHILNLSPLGISTLIIADDPQLIAAARTAYAHWLAEAPPPEPRIELRLEIGDASPSVEVCFEIAVEGSRLWLQGSGVNAEADSASHAASAKIGLDLIRDRVLFTEVVDTLLLFLLARDGRTPVHAASFMVGDLAVVLAGPSGSGKSTLALAAAERGFPLLSDDTVFVQRDPSFTLWGLPRPIHVFAADAPAGEYPVRVRGGKLKVAIPSARNVTKADRAALVLLDRGGELDIHPMEPSIAVDALMKLDAGFDLLREESREALAALASDNAWRLTLTADPAAAIDLITAHFGA